MQNEAHHQHISSLQSLIDSQNTTIAVLMTTVENFRASLAPTASASVRGAPPVAGEACDADFATKSMVKDVTVDMNTLVQGVVEDTKELVQGIGAYVSSNVFDKFTPLLQHFALKSEVASMVAKKFDKCNREFSVVQASNYVYIYVYI